MGAGLIKITPKGNKAISCFVLFLLIKTQMFDTLEMDLNKALF